MGHIARVLLIQEELYGTMAKIRWTPIRKDELMIVSSGKRQVRMGIGQIRDKY